jgi:hypothetical protein
MLMKEMQLPALQTQHQSGHKRHELHGVLLLAFSAPALQATGACRLTCVRPCTAACSTCLRWLVAKPHSTARPVSAIHARRPNRCPLP